MTLVYCSHLSQPEAKKLKSGRFSGPASSDQAIQAIRKLQLHARQEPTRHVKTYYQMVSGLALALSRDNAKRISVITGERTRISRAKNVS